MKEQAIGIILEREIMCKLCTWSMLSIQRLVCISTRILVAWHLQGT